ncbi:MAG: DUF4159 domain-containing protein [Ignavibacteriaceae bacterium]|nr:DUF4159 domain-containing protein [Ignavibacteriaceae bacterium]
MKYFIIILFIVTNYLDLPAQSKDGFQIARVKYQGGGDWYNDPSAEVNLLNFIQQNTNIKVDARYQFVDLSSDEIFSYPFLFLTGHGNIVLSKDEVYRLRTYLENGGFLYIDDDYGLDNAVRREMKKVFPQDDFVELPFSYGLYHSLYKFESGPPKTHEHDKNTPRGFGIFVNNRLAIYYNYESNPSDGWADAEVHDDPPEKREEALKFGTNIVVWALSQ